MSWHGRIGDRSALGEPSPWMQMFVNARNALA
jgi:hypothetical protein